jgi:translocation protein SEC63
MLQYDNSAFNYFALSSLVFYLVPSWYIIITRFYKAFIGTRDADIGAEVRTSAEKQKASEIKKNFKGLRTLQNPGFIFNLVLTIVLTCLFYYLILSVATDGEVNTFDPFSILEVDSGADSRTIKKAYREKSLRWHPDKNPNNPEAEAKFMMINKAYDALTDATARENWEKYGNPDGKQSLEVSIGLPSFLLDPSNRNLVLLTYLICMVVIVPLCVWRYYSDSSKFGEKDVMYDSYSWFHHTLSEHSIIKGLPEILAGSAEFRQHNMPKTSKDKEEIGTIMGKVRSQMQKPKYNHPVCVKGNVLLHAHLLRKTDELSETAKEDLNMMLRHSNSLVEAMITVCTHQEWMQTAMNCIQFGQYITQAMWIKDSSLLQLPYFTEEEVSHCSKGKASQQANNILDYIKLPNGDKKGMANMTDEQKHDVLKVCTLIPEIEVTSRVYVDDDEDDRIYDGDLCTLEINIDRTNLPEGEKPGLVHAPRFPFPKMEAWWIIVGTKEGKIVRIDKVVGDGKVITHKVKFMASREGTYKFDVHVMSNAYVGLNDKHSVEFKTIDSSGLPEYKVHPDDAELDDEPTLFEEMLNANVEQDSDSDDSDDEEEEEESDKNISKEDKKKMEMRNARRKNVDDDSDDDSSVEEVYTEK